MGLCVGIVGRESRREGVRVNQAMKLQKLERIFSRSFIRKFHTQFVSLLADAGERR